MSYYSPHKPYLGSSIDRTIPAYSGYFDRPYYDRYDQGYQRQVAPPRRGEQWSEYIPVEQRYTDMIPETRVEYRPIEKSYTDYIEVKHETDYVPVPRMEKRVEYIPVDRYEEHVDYMPVQSSHVVKTPSNVGPQQTYNSGYAPTYSQGYGYGQGYGQAESRYYGGGDRYQRSGRPYSFGGYSGYGYRYL